MYIISRYFSPALHTQGGLSTGIDALTKAEQVSVLRQIRRNILNVVLTYFELHRETEKAKNLCWSEQFPYLCYQSIRIAEEKELDLRIEIDDGLVGQIIFSIPPINIDTQFQWKSRNTIRELFHCADRAYLIPAENIVELHFDFELLNVR